MLRIILGILIIGVAAICTRRIEQETATRRRATSRTSACLPIQQDETERILAFLEEEIWPQIPASVLGAQLSKDEEEAILGYGEHGV
jgi:hypothetical protein